MRKVRLYANDGGFVETVLIPDFLPDMHPQMIIWGTRFFFFRTVNEYTEGFGIVAVTKAEVDAAQGEVVGMTQEHKTEQEGDDNLFANHPTTLEDAADDFLTFFSKAEDFNDVIILKEDEFVGMCHHASGQFLRNNYYLWWHENHRYAAWPKNRPPLVKYFNDLGITHADDMSSMILRTAWRMHHKAPIAEDEQVVLYKEFWKKEGFPDGIFVPKRQ